MATKFIQTWMHNTFSPSHINYFYSDTSSDGLMYNLYADILLGLDFVPADVFTTLTGYYSSLTSGELLEASITFVTNFPCLRHDSKWRIWFTSYERNPSSDFSLYVSAIVVFVFY